MYLVEDVFETFLSLKLPISKLNHSIAYDHNYSLTESSRGVALGIPPYFLDQNLGF